jgi:hypothetical protein
VRHRPLTWSFAVDGTVRTVSGVHVAGGARHAGPVEADLFTDAAEILRSLLPDELGSVHMRASRWALKVWFGPDQPAREHYEAQVVGARHVPGATVLALEIGFHAEYPKPEDNERVMRSLLAEEKRWRRALGTDPVAGDFLGRGGWQRVSETWIDPNLGEPDMPEEIGMRLLDYITALEPARVAG